MASAVSNGNDRIRKGNLLRRPNRKRPNRRQHQGHFILNIRISQEFRFIQLIYYCYRYSKQTFLNRYWKWKFKKFAVIVHVLSNTQTVAFGKTLSCKERQRNQKRIKSECPLRPSERWHMMKNQNSLYFAQR